MCKNPISRKQFHSASNKSYVELTISELYHLDYVGGAWRHHHQLYFDNNKYMTECDSAYCPIPVEQQEIYNEIHVNHT